MSWTTSEALKTIINYLNEEFPDSDNSIESIKKDLSRISMGVTDNDYGFEISSYIDLINFKHVTLVNNKEYVIHQYTSLNDLCDDVLFNISFMDILKYGMDYNNNTEYVLVYYYFHRDKKITICAVRKDYKNENPNIYSFHDYIEDKENNHEKYTYNDIINKINIDHKNHNICINEYKDDDGNVKSHSLECVDCSMIIADNETANIEDIEKAYKNTLNGGN